MHGIPMIDKNNSGMTTRFDIFNEMTRKNDSIENDNAHISTFNRSICLVSDLVL